MIVFLIDISRIRFFYTTALAVVGTVIGRQSGRQVCLLQAEQAWNAKCDVG